MENELADFLRFCAIERRLTPLTCKAYERDIRACIAFLRERGIELLHLVRPADLRSLLAEEAMRRPALGSQARTVAALKVFFRFCVEAATERSDWKDGRRGAAVDRSLSL